MRYAEFEMVLGAGPLAGRADWDVQWRCGLKVTHPEVRAAARAGVSPLGAYGPVEDADTHRWQPSE